MLGIVTDGAIDLVPGWEKEFDIKSHSRLISILGKRLTFRMKI